MSLLFLSMIIIQVALIIHVVKTGRNQIWIWVLALLSLPGAIAYIAVEILPELFRSRTAQRTAPATCPHGLASAARLSIGREKFGFGRGCVANGRSLHERLSAGRSRQAEAFHRLGLDRLLPCI